MVICDGVMCDDVMCDDVDILELFRLQFYNLIKIIRADPCMQ
jgi:hypothetical protein